MSVSEFQYQGFADLHTHSLYSDGRDRPSEVVRRAAEKGLSGLALTDHDTMEGIAEARTAATSSGIDFIAGVELTTVTKNKEVHVLGYFPNEPTDEFLALLSNTSMLRVGRMKRMIAKLNALGMEIAEEDVFKLPGGQVMGRAHLFRAIRDRFSGAFDDKANKWLKVGGAAFEATSDMLPVEAVAAILEAGGVPVLAHPGTSDADQFLSELVDAGLKGIEAVYPKHASSAVSRYKRFAKARGLIITGGSDWHGIFEGSALYHSETVGQSRVGIEVMEQIREAAGS